MRRWVHNVFSSRSHGDRRRMLIYLELSQNHPMRGFSPEAFMRGVQRGMIMQCAERGLG